MLTYTAGVRRAACRPGLAVLELARTCGRQTIRSGRQPRPWSRLPRWVAIYRLLQWVLAGSSSVAGVRVIPSVIPAVTDALVGLSEAAVEPPVRRYSTVCQPVKIPPISWWSASPPHLLEPVDGGDGGAGLGDAGDLSRDESGSLDRIAYAVDGDSDQKAARDRVFAAVAAIGAAVLSDLTSAVCRLLWSGVRITHYDQAQSDFGAGRPQISFQLGFRARIWEALWQRSATFRARSSISRRCRGW